MRLAASRGGAPEVLPLPAETSREAQKCCAWQHQGGGPRNALRHRPELEALPLPAETSREPGSIEGGGPETRSGTVPEPEVLPLPARLKSAAPGSSKGEGPENALEYRPEPEVLPLPAETSREGSRVLRLAASV